VTNRVVSVVMQAEIGQYVSGMTKAALATKGVGETAERTAKQSQRGFDLAGRGAVLFGAAAAGALVGVVTKSIEFEKAMSGVAAATGATGAALGQLREAAVRAGADTQYSATEAANAITEMAKAGVSAKDIMGGGLAGALSLAAAGQLDVSEAAGIAATAMTQFSLSGSQLPHVADLLAAGAGKAMGSVDDMGQALNQAGLLASSAGISIEETTGALAAFASAGLIGSDAGTSFKTMLQQLQNPSKESAELMAELGINAYDAQGNFVGLAGLAGQLQTKLGGLTQAQRDQALAQIFGSDAARAATVLYREGASGIQEWTNKVNDAGYAQEQAAALTDNLSGDLERLGGSFDTLLISIGEGAQGPLRDLVQLLGGLVDGVSGAVDVFGALPGPIQLSLAAAGTWAVVGSRVSGAFDGMRTKVQGFREESELQRSLLAAQQRTADEAGASYGTLAERIDAATGVSRQLGDDFEVVGYKAATARAAVAGFVRAIGPELAAAAGAYLLTDIAGDISEVVNAGDDATEAIKNLRDAIKGADSNQARFDATAAGIDELKSKIADAQAVIDNYNDESVVHHAFVGQFQDEYTTDVADAKEALRLYQDELDKTERKQKAAGESASELGTYFGLTADEVVTLADKYGVDLTQGADAAFAALAAAKTAEEEAARGADAATTTTELFAQSLQDTADAADEAKQQTDLFKMSLDILTGAHISLSEAEAAMYAALAESKGALDNLTGSVLNNAGQLNVQSEAGRKAQEVLHGIRDEGDQYIATLIQQGASTDEVIAADHHLRESFIQSAQQMGISREAAEHLADQILGIPSERETKITADTQGASGEVASFQRQVDDLHGKTVTVTVVADRGALAIFQQTHNPNAAISIGGGLAFGGEVPGTSPHDRADNVPIMATAGEFMQQRPAVRKYGMGFMEAVNEGRFPLELARGYADGGLINVEMNSEPLVNTALGVFELMKKAYEPGAAALAWARTQVGKPYIWGASGPTGYDCSGFQSAITNLLLGQDPYSRRGSTATFPWSGFQPGYGAYTIGSTPNAGGGIGHMAGTLLGVNVESNGSDGVVVGSRARGASDSLFSTRAHLAMFNGGVIGEPVFGFGASGRSYSFAERGPEIVLPTGREVSGGGSGSSAPVTVNFEGAEITGRLEFDESGMVRLVDGRIVNAVTDVNRKFAAAGVR
jgi:TP901 family phage tail tape measure protein